MEKAEIGDEGKRMCGIDGERRQQRKNVRQEVLFQPSPLRFGDVPAFDQDDVPCELLA